jgi:hypothetical protein
MEKLLKFQLYFVGEACLDILSEKGDVCPSDFQPGVELTWRLETFL